MINYVYNPFKGTFTEMNDEPKKTPTLEDCLALMKTAKGDVAQVIRFYRDGSCDVLSNTANAGVFNIIELHQWLTERQPSKTVTVEIDRKDAESLCNNFRLSSYAGSRVHGLIKKALEN